MNFKLKVIIIAQATFHSTERPLRKGLAVFREESEMSYADAF